MTLMNTYANLIPMGMFMISPICSLTHSCNNTHTYTLTDEDTVPGACFKNCSARKHNEVCGNDGRRYFNACELRAQNCLIPEGRQPPKIKPASSKTCREGI